MKLENQVCSFEQAKRLSELKVGETGFPLFVWVPEFPIFNEALRLCTFAEFESRLKNSILSDDAKALVGYYPAFTLSELGQMLDSETYTQRTGSEDSEYANWEYMDDNNQLGWGNFNTEVEARAAMLIAHLEKEIVAAETCNERLVA